MRDDAPPSSRLALETPLVGRGHFPSTPSGAGDRPSLMSHPDSPSSAPTPPPPDWNAIARDADFKALVQRKLKLVVPATVFFVVYYFALPIGVGWFPDFMKQKIWGDVNIAYLFALSQFFMAWILALIYVVAAAGWDRSERSLLAKFGFTSEH